MSGMTERDRRILLAIVPLVIAVAYWFLLLAPKREEAATAQKDLTTQQQRVSDAQAKVSQATASKSTFAADYTQMVRLGKAIPTKVDMPSLIVQLDKASDGTGIRFTKIATGERSGDAAAPPAQSGSGGGSNPPAAAGGQQAQSGPGTAAETANNTAANQNQQAANANNQANQNSSGTPSSGNGSSQQGSSSSGATPAGSAPPPGLESVPLELEFQGDFFNLADFFHRLKRLVHVKGDNVAVSGRLVTIDSVKYASDPESFPKINAEIKATVYLSPQAQGTTAGATPAGPAEAAPAATPGGSPSTPPAATATPAGAAR